MEDEIPTPPTQTSGALVPPTRLPPTAVARPADFPEHPQARHTTSRFRDVANRTLDAVDELADAVAEGLGLRPL